MISVLIIVLFACLILTIPVGFSIGLAVVIYTLVDGRFPVGILVQRAISGVDSFPMLALPLFIFVGYLMELGSTPRLMRFANSILGPLPGGLPLANISASTLFGAVSGSGVATIAAVGSVMGPEMVRQGYPRGFAAGVLASSGGLGILIPPSVPLIIFGLVGGVSIGKLFLAGVVPGIVTAILLGIAAILISWLRGYGTRTNISLREVGVSFLHAIPPLVLPVLILGGILGGVFTPTEAAAVGVVYAFILGALVYREITWSKLMRILTETVITSAVILLIIAMSAAFAWIVTINQVPNMVAAWLENLSQSPLMVMIIIQCFFLLLGMFMETIAIIIITTPIFLPIAVGMGFDPLVYGVVLIINLIIGSVTPPLAVGIYTASRIVDAKPMETNAYILIFIIPLLISGLLHILFPELVLFLPTLVTGR